MQIPKSVISVSETLLGMKKKMSENQIYLFFNQPLLILIFIFYFIFCLLACFLFYLFNSTKLNIQIISIN